MMKGDFTQLYSHLDLRQDCTLAEFKRACRLRIGTLHPDKGHASNGQAGNEELSELLHLYTTATRFHRRHGRLPGARARRSLLAAGSAPTLPPTSHARSTDAPSQTTIPTTATQHETCSPAHAAQANGQRSVAFASLLVIAVTVLALAWDWPGETAVPASASDIAPVVAPEASETFAPAASPQRLELGMDPASVLAIQGKPVSVNGERWDYGPSWVRFANGQLVDWRSSPLHHLRTATPSPPPARPDASTP